MKTSRRPLAVLLALSPAIALAHPGHDFGSGIAAGAAHPLIGADHLVAALMAGAWGVQQRGRLRLALPASFLAMIIAGLLFAPRLPFPVGATEQMIGVSLLVMGAVLALAWRLPSGVSVGLASGFAFFHGLAHGAERPAGDLLGYGTGLVTTTALLLGAGVIAGTLAQARSASLLLRWAGVAGIAGGVALLG